MCRLLDLGKLYILACRYFGIGKLLCLRYSLCYKLGRLSYLCNRYIRKNMLVHMLFHYHSIQLMVNNWYHLIFYSMWVNSQCMLDTLYMFYMYKSNLYTYVQQLNNKFFQDIDHDMFKYQDERQDSQEDNIDILNSSKSLQVFQILYEILFIPNQPGQYRKT